MFRSLDSRLKLWILLGIFAGGMACGLQKVSAQDDEPSLSVEQIRVKLRDPADADFKDVPLRDCLTQLLEPHGIPLIIDEAIAEEFAEQLDKPLTCTLQQVTLNAALARCLLGKPLGFYLTDFGLVLTKDELANRHMSARVYDVTDLTPLFQQLEIKIPLPPAPPAPPESPDDAAKPTSKSTPAAPAKQFGMGGQAPDDAGLNHHGPHHQYWGHRNHEADQFSALVEIQGLIQSSFQQEPIQWVDTAGEGGTVLPLKTPHACLLVISQNEKAHYLIENLLNELILVDHDREENPDRLDSTPEKRAEAAPRRVRIVSRSAVLRRTNQLPQRLTIGQ